MQSYYLIVQKLNALLFGYFSERHPRCEACTAWLKLQIRERGCAQKDKQPALFLSLEERRTLVICFRKKGPEPWINVYTGSTREQRILGYLKTGSTQVNRPGLSLWHRGLAWLRPALCELIMPAGRDCRKEPLLKSATYNKRITIQHPKNLICSYGCWAWQSQQSLGFLISPESTCFVSGRGCFLYRLIYHGKFIEGMSLWPYRGGHRPNKDQLSKHWPGQDITRNPLDKLFSLWERIRVNSRGNLDWIFGGWKGFTTSYKSGMTNTNGFASFHFTDQITAF